MVLPILMSYVDWCKKAIVVAGVVVVFLNLSGCTLLGIHEQEADTTLTESSFDKQDVNLQDVLQGENLVALRKDNSLFLVDPQFAYPVEVYQFSADDFPIRSGLYDLHLSPSKQWVVWYTPKQGIVALNVVEKKTVLLEPASDWLNNNPYLEFAESTDTLLFTSDGGEVLNRVDVGTNTHERITIPYPFGNVFKISPDSQYVLFTSAYAQDTDRPEFMFTDISGKNPKRFKTDTNIFDRHHVVWSPDSKYILMIVGNNITGFSYQNPEEQITLVSLPDKANILDLQRVEDRIFAQTDQGYWHVYDYEDRKEVGRTPIEIAVELKKPKFYPWSPTEFLIEETQSRDSLRYQRLWLSNFRGSKKLLVPEYGETIVHTESVQLE